MKMVIPIYCIRDVMNGFMNLILDLNDNSARRNFAYSINNNDQMAFSPKDYDLYKMGTFDQESGKIEVIEPLLICHGSEVFGVE